MIWYTVFGRREVGPNCLWRAAVWGGISVCKPGVCCDSQHVTDADCLMRVNPNPKESGLRDSVRKSRRRRLG